MNRELTDWTGPHGLPRFDLISDADFAPAMDAALAQADTAIEAIAANPAPASTSASRGLPRSPSQASTLVLWAEDNAFHSWAKFTPLAAPLFLEVGRVPVAGDADERLLAEEAQRLMDESGLAQIDIGAD